MLLCKLGMTQLDQQIFVIMYSGMHLRVEWSDQDSESLAGMGVAGVGQASLYCRR